MEANIQSKSNKHEPLVYSCDKCEREFKRRSSLTRHIHSNHEPIEVTLCKLKSISFSKSLLFILS